MGRELLGASRTFRESIEECASVVAPLGVDLLAQFEVEPGPHAFPLLQTGSSVHPVHVSLVVAGFNTGPSLVGRFFSSMRFLFVQTHTAGESGIQLDFNRMFNTNCKNKDHPRYQYQGYAPTDILGM
jgi:hypothetical protein